MSKVKYFPKPVGEPEDNGFFKGAVVGLAICLPFWFFVSWLIFG